MGRRRSPSPLLFVLAVLLAALLHLAQSSSRHQHHHHHGHGHHSHLQSRGHGGGEGGEQQAPARETRQWPCCDNCGSCTKSIPPQCRCMDAAPSGCHPACQDCVRSALSVHPPVYQCMDRIKNFCQRRCNAVAAH